MALYCCFASNNIPSIVFVWNFPNFWTKTWFRHSGQGFLNFSQFVKNSWNFHNGGIKELLSWKLSIESQNYIPELFLDQKISTAISDVFVHLIVKISLIFSKFVKISLNFHKFHVRAVWAKLVDLGTFLRPPYALWSQSETFRKSPLPSISTEPYCYDLWKFHEIFTIHLASVFENGMVRVGDRSIESDPWTYQGSW